MISRLNILLILLILIPLNGIGQKGQKYSYKKKFGTQKNAMYISWGYNRALYTLSDITFHGPDYDFTLRDAAAHDRPVRNYKTYFNPATISIPQFNFRVGWYYKFRWDISIGYDHMKYAMDQYQNLIINGVIEDTGNPMEGVYSDADGVQAINPANLHYENTNGLNYVSFQLNNTAPIFKTKDLKFAVLRRLGGGFGPIINQTDFTWDGNSYESGFHIGGYGVSTNFGLRFDFFNRFFFQSNWTAGMIHLPKNNTIQNQNHYAKQQFFFAEWDLSMGLLLYIRTVNGCDTCPDWN